MSGAPTSVLRHPPFVLFWTARVMSTIAIQMQVVGVGWQIYELTGSAFDLGLVGLAQFLPSVILLLLTGHVIDRYSRRTILRVCQIAGGCAVAVLAFGSAAGWLTRDIIFAIVFVIGIARAFESPALHALVPGTVPPALLPRAVAGSTSANQVATITGPALGGILFAVSPAMMYALAAALFVSASILVTFIRATQATPGREPVTPAVLFAGISFIRRSPLVLGALSMDLFAVLLGGATALLPIFASDVFDIGPWGLGILRASMACGALGMSIFLARHPIARHAGRTMFAAVALFGIATIVFGLSRSLPLSVAALLVLGAADTISVVIRMTLVQLQTPDELRGRVTAVNSLFVGTSNQLGEFESGLTAALFGTVPAVLLGGIGTLIVVAVWSRLFPDLIDVQDLNVNAVPKASALTPDDA